MEYRIGLDIGIGSVGWAVVSGKDSTHERRIEDFGVRIFESGENVKDRQSNCQERRGHRGVRRLERRRAHRKQMLLNHFVNNGLTNVTFHDELADLKDADVYRLKVSGLDEALSLAALYKCLAHTCNHRGYRDFYETDIDDDDDEESSQNAAAADAFERAFRASGQRTVSEYLLAEYGNGEFIKLRNRQDGIQPYTLIRRSLMQEEVEALLNAQKPYHEKLTDTVIQRALDIIFSQRDFEDGPGDPNDANRKYFGFLETLGKCTFYREEDRSFRGTVVADVYAVTNTLSQYRFVNQATGEYTLEPAIAEELIATLMKNANLTMTDVKNILKRHGYKLMKGERSDDKALGKSIKFMKMAKAALGDQWDALIAEEVFDRENPSRLQKIGELLSKYQTPKRRREEMRKAGILQQVINALSGKKVSGTASVSYKYMCDAIAAFRNGDIYGNFQSKVNQRLAEEQPIRRYPKLLPSHIDDPEVKTNRVVFKAINETRKIVNAIIDTYGAPTEIVIEVASELGKSFASRSEEMACQRRNEKANDQVRKTVSELLGIEESEVNGDMIDRYKLFNEQQGKCMYSGKPLGAIVDVVRNAHKAYEVDHIVPFSLILDNTLNNKALVFSGENQAKGQRTPLMYMDGGKAAEFRTSVQQMYSRKDNPISKKKLDYFLLADIYSGEAREMMDGWKSRNINDTRYITKYIAGVLSQNLVFAGDPQKRHVQTVKGVVTQRFRREWLRALPWGDYEKSRENYMNHAIDALICANLTLPYIEIGSDAIRLRRIFFESNKKYTNAYRDYLDDCVRKMKKYYGFQEEYTRRLLSDPHRIPAYLPRLSQEVDCRFNDTNPEEFATKVEVIYGHEAPFIVPPHMPLTSFKQERKFCGTICDDNPVRIVEENGKSYKVQRVSILSVNSKNVERVRTGDPKLMAQLRSILESYGSIGEYLKDQEFAAFVNAGGQVVRKVSMMSDKPISNFYRKENGGGNYTNLSGLKYYCVEVYKDANGKLHTYGIRFVDVVKKGKKLYQKKESIPTDYAEHVMYLFKNDYIRVVDGKQKLKYEGFYRAVYTISQGKFYVQQGNQSEISVKSIASSDTVIKYDISILGNKGGKIRCSEPLPFIEVKK